MKFRNETGSRQQVHGMSQSFFVEDGQELTTKDLPTWEIRRLEKIFRTIPEKVQEPEKIKPIKPAKDEEK